MVRICLSLIISDIERLLVCLLAVWMSLEPSPPSRKGAWGGDCGITGLGAWGPSSVLPLLSHVFKPQSLRLLMGAMRVEGEGVCHQQEYFRSPSENVILNDLCFSVETALLGPMQIVTYFG